MVLYNTGDLTLLSLKSYHNALGPITYYAFNYMVTFWTIFELFNIQISIPFRCILNGGKKKEEGL